MIINMVGGGGGAALNFKVVAGLTQPGSATENTIWIKTEKMTGWIIDANQPEELTEGMVWIPVGTKSDVEFNALKKNGLQVYPLSAKQYVDGSLVTLTASIYQSGEWIEFSRHKYHIFKAGEGAVVPLKTYDEDNSSITFGKNNISIDYSYDISFYTVSLRTEDKINLTPYSTLCMTATVPDVISAEYSVLGITSTGFTEAAEPSVFTKKTSISESSSKKTYKLDIASTSTTSYVGFLFGGKMTVTDIWLE